MHLAFVQVLNDEAREKGITDERCFVAGRNAARALIEQYLVELGEDLQFQNITQELMNLPGEYNPPLGAMFVAWRGPTPEMSEPVAIGAIRPLPGEHARESECEMKRLYVLPSARHGGLGRTLCEMLIEAAKNLGYGRMYLDTLDRLQSANALYRSLGFLEVPSYNGNPLPGVRFFAREL